jgi:predicted RNA-binding protein with TRAM domain
MVDGIGSLRCLFTAAVTERDVDRVVEVPRSEIDGGAVAPGETYRIGVLDATAAGGAADAEGAPSAPKPPLEPGELRFVEIEDLGKHGDGIARIERGYVVIVPGTDVGDRVKIEVVEVTPDYAVAEVVDGPA